MKTWHEILLDEKIVVCGMALLFSMACITLIKWGAEKEYVMLFGGFVSMLIGALLRGITHQPAVSDSTQSVQSTTTISPKTEVK